MENVLVLANGSGKLFRVISGIQLSDLIGAAGGVVLSDFVELEELEAKTRKRISGFAAANRYSREELYSRG